jgi:hypothetical protein
MSKEKFSIGIKTMYFAGHVPYEKYKLHFLI